MEEPQRDEAGFREDVGRRDMLASSATRLEGKVAGIRWGVTVELFAIMQEGIESTMEERGGCVSRHSSRSRFLSCFCAPSDAKVMLFSVQRRWESSENLENISMDAQDEQQ